MASMIREAQGKRVKCFFLWAARTGEGKGGALLSGEKGDGEEDEKQK